MKFKGFKRIAAIVTAIATAIAVIITMAATSSGIHVIYIHDDEHNWEFDLDISSFDWTYAVSGVHGWATKGFVVHGADPLKYSELPFEVLINAVGLMLEVSEMPSGISSSASIYWLGDASLNIASISGNTVMVRGDDSIFNEEAKTLNFEFKKVWSAHVYEDFRKNTTHAGIGLSYNPDLDALNITRAYLYGKTPPCDDCNKFPSDCIKNDDSVRMLGDVNGDGYVTITDALEILMFLAGMPSELDKPENFFVASAVSGGDKPTINGALEILMFLAGMDSKIRPITP
jgi:hypothetical protein